MAEDPYSTRSPWFIDATDRLHGHRGMSFPNAWTNVVALFTSIAPMACNRAFIVCLVAILAQSCADVESNHSQSDSTVKTDVTPIDIAIDDRRITIDSNEMHWSQWRIEQWADSAWLQADPSVIQARAIGLVDVDNLLRGICPSGPMIVATPGLESSDVTLQRMRSAAADSLRDGCRIIVRFLTKTYVAGAIMKAVACPSSKVVDRATFLIDRSARRVYLWDFRTPHSAHMSVGKDKAAVVYVIDSTGLASVLRYGSMERIIDHDDRGKLINRLERSITQEWYKPIDGTLWLVGKESRESKQETFAELRPSDLVKLVKATRIENVSPQRTHICSSCLIKAFLSECRPGSPGAD